MFTSNNEISSHIARYCTVPLYRRQARTNSHTGSIESDHKQQSVRLWQQFAFHNATAYPTVKGSVQKVPRFYDYSESNRNTKLVRLDSQTAGNRSLRHVGSYVPNCTMSHQRTQQPSWRRYSFLPVTRATKAAASH